ncbi:MAG: hypothetical protein KJI72_00660 [Patescibacteria group bacterium]|nr:hypothetical protein [Patescibacteria group bacterium]
MKKELIIGILVVLVLVIGGGFFLFNNSNLFKTYEDSGESSDFQENVDKEPKPVSDLIDTAERKPLSNNDEGSSEVSGSQENVEEEPIDEQSDLAEQETEVEESVLPECDGQTFTVPVVDVNNLEYIFPLGSINPPGHTLPTEHMYFGIDGEVPLVAPGDVYIIDVSGSKDLDKIDRGIRFALCKDVFGYFGHLSTLSEEIREAVKDIDCASWYTESNDLCSRELQYKVKAGTVLGTVGAHHGQVDFGTYDYRTRLNYANPLRYGIPYFIERGEVKGWSVVCPIELYDDPLRQQLYDKVTGGIDPKCGEVMQDIKGTLQGNWFIGEVEGDWENSIAFVHDNSNPSKIIISIDGGFTGPGKYEFVPKNTGFFNRKFSDVTADGNIYCYEGEDPGRTGQEKPEGRIIIELVSDTELQIEHQSGDCNGGYKFINPTVYNR